MRALRALWPWLKKGWGVLRAVGDALHLRDILDAVGAYSHLGAVLTWGAAALALWANVAPVVVISVATPLFVLAGMAAHRNIRHNRDHETFMRETLDFVDRQQALLEEQQELIKQQASTIKRMRDEAGEEST